MGKLVVLGGSSGEHLAIKTARLLDSELGFIEVKKFPDGETYVRIHADVGGRDVLYINSLQHGVNDLVIETIYTLDTLKDLGAKHVYAVIPYMAYARQDARFNPGEAVSIVVLAKLFKTLDLDAIYTFDMHLHRIVDPKELFGTRFYNLSAVSEIAGYVRENYSLGEDAVVIGPDEEAIQWAKRLGEELGGLEYSVLEKKRVSAEEVVIEARDVDVRDRDVVIVDDIISTGGTMVEAIKALKKQGARNILVTCIHPLLVGRALYRILRLNPIDIVCTDTVLSPVSKISIAPVIAKEIRRYV